MNHPAPTGRLSVHETWHSSTDGQKVKLLRHVCGQGLVVTPSLLRDNLKELDRIAAKAGLVGAWTTIVDAAGMRDKEEAVVAPEHLEGRRRSRPLPPAPYVEGTLAPCYPKPFNEIRKGDVFAAALREADGSIRSLPLLLVAESNYTPSKGIQAHVINGNWHLNFSPDGASKAPVAYVPRLGDPGKMENRRLGHLAGYEIVFTGPWPEWFKGTLKGGAEAIDAVPYDQLLTYARSVMTTLAKDIAAGQAPATLEALKARVEEAAGSSPAHPDPEHPHASIAVFEFKDGTELRIPVLWGDDGQFDDPEGLAAQVICNPELDSKLWNVGIQDEYVYRIANPEIRKEIRFEEQAGAYFTRPVKAPKSRMKP
jgi:hypothetical protein